MTKIEEIMVACDAVECGYRIVSLDDGRYAFVWGNIRCQAGDIVGWLEIAEPTDTRGVEVFHSYDDALAAYRQRAESLQQCGSGWAGDEMLAVLG